MQNRKAFLDIYVKKSADQFLTMKNGFFKFNLLTVSFY